MSIKFVTGNVVGQALKALGSDNFAKRQSGHLTVLDFSRGVPAATRDFNTRQLTEDGVFARVFDSIILEDREYNFDGQYKLEYKENARAKAILAGRTQMSTGEVISQHPLLLSPGDGKYQGGIYVDGIAVGFSGVQAPYDEALAKIYAAIMTAHVQVTTAERLTQPGNFF